MRLLLITVFLTGQLLAAPQVLRIRQTWSQEPEGFDREVLVSLPRSTESKAPVIIFFHGNGGTASRSLKEWASRFPDHLVAAAQGYEKSWNIHGERSKAPDVAFFRSLIAKVAETYAFADMKRVTLIGSSNGAGLIHRLLIEVDEDLFQKAVPLVASMIVQQFHEGSFWMPEDGDTDQYTSKKVPSSNRQILYIHGSEDQVVPFKGGLRFGKFLHLSAPKTAFRWAQAQGYQGEQLASKSGEGLIEYHYEGTEVTFLEVSGGNHSLKPHRDAVKERIRRFVED